MTDLDPFEDGTWMHEARERQMKLATAYASRLAEGPWPWRDAGADGGLDPEAVRAFLLAELERGCAEAVIALTEWMACRVVRAAIPPGLRRPDLGRAEIEPLIPATVPLPRADEAELARFPEHLEDGMPTGLLARVQELLRAEPEIPLLGRVEEGALRIDVGTLSHWAEGFDWTK